MVSLRYLHALRSAEEQLEHVPSGVGTNPPDVDMFSGDCGLLQRETGNFLYTVTCSTGTVQVLHCKSSCS